MLKISLNSLESILKSSPSFIRCQLVEVGTVLGSQDLDVHIIEPCYLLLHQILQSGIWFKVIEVVLEESDVVNQFGYGSEINGRNNYKGWSTSRFGQKNFDLHDMKTGVCDDTEYAFV